MTTEERLSGWRGIAEAPRDGSRIRLGHEQDAGSMKAEGIGKVFGEWDESSGRWLLSAFFIIPGGRHGMMTEHPTHYLPAPPATGQGGER